jgi:hypothetical protein
MINSAANIRYQGLKDILGCNLKAGMNMEQALEIIDALLEQLFKGASLECIKLSDYGIDCKPEDESSILCLLLDTLLQSQLALSERLNQITRANTNVQTATQSISDEKVKATKDSTTAKYLLDILSATTGRLKYDPATDTVKITGLVPIGARMYINPKRSTDFDTNGKGKVGTDLEGWAYRDGRNGLDNAMGYFPRYTDTIANAGKKDGKNAITIKKENIETFTLPVAGTIADALTIPVRARVPYGTLHKCFGVSSCRDVVVPSATPDKYYESDALNIQHTHNFSLTVDHDNATPEDVSILPEHIKEIPIEFIGI